MAFIIPIEGNYTNAISAQDVNYYTNTTEQLDIRFLDVIYSKRLF